MLTPTTVGRAGQGHGWDETAPARPGPAHCTTPGQRQCPLFAGEGAVKAALDLSSPWMVVGRARWPPSSPSQSCLSPPSWLQGLLYQSA